MGTWNGGGLTAVGGHQVVNVRVLRVRVRGLVSLAIRKGCLEMVALE